MQKSEKLNESSQKKGWTKRWNMLLLMEEIRLTSWYGGPTIIYLQDFSQQQQHFKVQWTFWCARYRCDKVLPFHDPSPSMQNFVISSFLNIFFSPKKGYHLMFSKFPKKKQNLPLPDLPNLHFCAHKLKNQRKKRQKWGYTTFEKAPGELPALPESPGPIPIAWTIGEGKLPFDSPMMYLPTVRFIKGWFGWGIPRKMPQPCRFWNYSNIQYLPRLFPMNAWQGWNW